MARPEPALTFSFADVAVVILAAGSGRRLGLGPKAHVELRGESFLSRVVDTCRGAGLGPTWVVGSVDDGRIAAFLHDLWKKKKLAASDGHAVMNLCMAATYDPDPTAPNGFRVPFDLETGELLEARWKKWLAHDPIHMVTRHAAALRSLRGIYIDCGWADQYHIHYGTRILSKRLAELKIAHVYEEFDDTHSDIDYRMDVSLPFLARSLSATSSKKRRA